MPPEEPSWWYGEPRPLVEAMLRPAGVTMGALARWRFTGHRPYRSTLPVICVGNFTVGGTGKTPTALFLAGLLAPLGARVAFLTRGYKGTERGPHWVDTARDTAAHVGDEPLLLAATCPTLVSRDRAAGARAIEAAGTADVIVMDDGLQNPALAKDLTLAVVDGRRGFGNGLVVPAGPLRAPLEFQLDLVDAIVVNGGPAAEPAGGDGIGARLRATFGGPVLAARVEPAGTTDWIAGSPLVAFCGIGAPQRFFDLLVNLGAALSDTIAFPDHHTYGAADAERLLARAAAAGARLVTTEKDIARLAGLGGAMAALRDASTTVPIRLAMEATDTERLLSLLRGALGGSRGSAAASHGPGADET